MSDVFISYSRKNNKFARRLIDNLILHGKDAWVDWEGIPLTSPNWWMEIKTGIEAADSFVFIMSPAISTVSLPSCLDCEKCVDHP